MTIAEMIGETPEMMLACGRILAAEVGIKYWTNQLMNDQPCGFMLEYANEELNVARGIMLNLKATKA
jgi:hypothetical protein